jgi:hypothetical protein
MRPDIKYILDDENNPVPATLMEWAEFFENTPRRIVAQDYPRPKVLVSTVFLGLDHRFVGDGPPLLFETMVFRDGDGDEQMRYATWAEAEAGHAAMLKEVMEEKE